MHLEHGSCIGADCRGGGFSSNYISSVNSRTWTQQSILALTVRKHSTPTSDPHKSALWSARTTFGISHRRNFCLSLPPFSTQEPDTLQLSQQECKPQGDDIPQSRVEQQIERNVLSRSPVLLTPPLQDSIVMLGPTDVRSNGRRSKTVFSSSDGASFQSQNSVDRSSARSPRPPNLPTPLPVPHQTRLQDTSWVARVSQIVLSLLQELQSAHQIQLISQTMPSQAKDARSKPTFEEILAAIQMGMEISPFITITHAVPQVRIMEELPKTPPSTPNARHDINDYFGGDQTIFTHAAVVPIYHTYGRLDIMSATHLPHHIAAPYSVQVSILERYIPPTMALEVIDFFSVSGHSYLVDRLSELSPQKGALLLVYPTKTGASTFVRKYLGPVLDPLLRQFALLNNLTSDAATSLGKTVAAEKMMDFQQMKHAIQSMCNALTQRPAIRGSRSSYSLIHSETAEVTLDRSTWINWFVEQEQPRLRQNLNEYHQAGGRMPGSTGHKEITTGMLTRELIEGIQKSKEHAGETGIEVGVFVLTRSMLA